LALTTAKQSFASKCVPKRSLGTREKTGMKLEPLHPVQIQRFRQMTPVEKWDVALGLLRTARETRRAALRGKNPSLTESEIERALAKELSCART
jgi:hypothetical protein